MQLHCPYFSCAPSMQTRPRNSIVAWTLMHCEVLRSIHCRQSLLLFLQGSGYTLRSGPWGRKAGSGDIGTMYSTTSRPALLNFMTLVTVQRHRTLTSRHVIMHPCRVLDTQPHGGCIWPQIYHFTSCSLRCLREEVL